jgi:lantibiotic transport system permease protein
MIKFVNSLSSEMMKIKGSALLWLTILGTLIIPLGFIVHDLSNGIHLNKLTSGPEDWMMLYGKVIEPFIMFVLPMGIILICSLIAQVEYKNNNWKQVHTTPQRFTTIFFAKYSVLFLLAVLVFFLLIVGIVLQGVIPTLILDATIPKQSFPFGLLLIELVKCFIVILPIIALQYLVSLTFKNFLLSIGIGLAFFVGTILLIRTKMGLLSPFSYVIYYINGKMPDLHHRMYAQALVIFGLLTVLNYTVYITKRLKG